MKMSRKFRNCCLRCLIPDASLQYGRVSFPSGNECVCLCLWKKKKTEFRCKTTGKLAQESLVSLCQTSNLVGHCVKSIHCIPFRIATAYMVRRDPRGWTTLKETPPGNVFPSLARVLTSGTPPIHVLPFSPRFFEPEKTPKTSQETHRAPFFIVKGNEIKEKWEKT